jgi:hypothetical protein
LGSVSRGSAPARSPGFGLRPVARGSRLSGTLLAFGGDALQQLGRRFVVRVLRDELAGEGVTQDGLAQRLRGLQFGFQIGFDVVDDRKLSRAGLSARAFQTWVPLLGDSKAY